MAGSNRMQLPLDAVLKIRDLYAERDSVRRYLPRYTHAQIAKMMDCSPSTVARVINREGAYAWVGGQSMGEAKDDPALAAAAKASLRKLQHMVAADAEAEPSEPSGGLDTLTPEMQAEVARIKAKLGNL